MKDFEENDIEDPDAHNCRDHVDDYGYCSFCGALVYGTSAYYEECGCDPPGTVTYKD